LYHEFRYLESIEEAKIFTRAVNSFFEECNEKGDLSDESYCKFMQFIDDVHGNEVQLSNVFAEDTFHMGNRTTGRIEGENSCAKGTGVNPGTSVVRLAIIDVTRNSNRFFESELRYQREAMTKPIDSDEYGDLASKITLKAWELLKSQIEVYTDYIVTVNPTKGTYLQFDVISKKNRYRGNYHEMINYAYELEGNASISVLLPRFFRERKVELVEGFLKCSCSFFTCYGIPCRHMIAINKGVIGIQDIHLRWTTTYAKGLLDSKLKDMDDTVMSPGAVYRSNADDFPLTFDPNADNDTLEDEHASFGNEEVFDADDFINNENSGEAQNNSSDTIPLCNRSIKNLTPAERYRMVNSLVEKADDLAKQFAGNPKAAEYYIEHMTNFINNCEDYMKKEQGIEYEKIPKGSVMDSLAVKNSSRKNSRTKRFDEVNVRSNRRQSTFQPSSAINESDVTFEPEIRQKGRPPKKPRTYSDD
jgi:hypothetical protein